MKIIRRILSTIRGLWRFQRSECTVSISLRHWSSLLLLLFTLFWFLYDLNNVAMMTFFALLGILLVCYIWALELGRKVTTTRNLLSTAVQVGDELEEEIAFENNSFLPALWIEFYDRSNIPGHTATGVNAIDGQTVNSGRIRTICSRRGVFTYGVWEQVMSDPFGVFTIRQVYSQPQEVLVYPPLAHLPESVIPGSKNQGDIRSLNQPLLADTVSAMSTRPYQPGDALRNIHWRTTARRDSLYVKIFSPEAYSTIWILPDLHRDVQSGEGENSTMEKCIILAATLAEKYLNERMAVGMILFSQKNSLIRPLRGIGNLWGILRALAPVEPVEAPDLAGALCDARKIVSSRDSLLIITPSSDPQCLKEIHAFTRTQQGGRIGAILLDPTPSGTPTQMESFATLLNEQRCHTLLYHTDQVIPRQGSLGAIRRWEFVSFGTGQVHTRQRPRSISEVLAGDGRWGQDRFQ